MKITIKELKTLIKSVISEQYGGRYPIFFDFEFNLKIGCNHRIEMHAVRQSQGLFV